MVFKVLLVATLVALARAAHPTEYVISAPSVDHGSVGSTQEHTIKGHYGQNAHSQYSSVANTAHSTSHVSRTSVSNDVIGYGAPAYGYGHVAAPAIAHAAYAAPAVAHVAAPAIAHAAYAAPAVRVAAPAYAYAPAHVAAAPAVAHVAAPAISYAHGGALYGHGGLAYGHGLSLGYGHGYGYRAAFAAPAAHYAAPLAAAHYAAPYAVKAAVAAPLVHTSFVGHGAHYAY
ncbi:unnamed protein product [Hermetia illucens]|uniref:Uncharacterized protein n=1 Tax=Hermetia illucens TaxID=343691 RepID=A0A7R8YZJ4_HERIL|nr:cuticle protein 16.5 [Hermetia illucens]CAD7090561.1 unnamed protein product [Hermetia illucens]